MPQQQTIFGLKSLPVTVLEDMFDASSLWSLAVQVSPDPPPEDRTFMQVSDAYRCETSNGGSCEKFGDQYWTVAGEHALLTLAKDYTTFVVRFKMRLESNAIRSAASIVLMEGTTASSFLLLDGAVRVVMFSSSRGPFGLCRGGQDVAVALLRAWQVHN